MTRADSEIALLHRFVDGDGRAFGEIVERYAGLVYGTCMRVLANGDKAADAAQETFFQLMKRANEVNGSLAGWLHRVAVCRSVDSIRGDLQRRSRDMKRPSLRQTRRDQSPKWRRLLLRLRLRPGPLKHRQ
jgi:RNA polymerase sigma factor (sigma-70 family)